MAVFSGRLVKSCSLPRRASLINCQVIGDRKNYKGRKEVKFVMTEKSTQLLKNYHLHRRHFLSLFTACTPSYHNFYEYPLFSQLTLFLKIFLTSSTTRVIVILDRSGNCVHGRISCSCSYLKLNPYTEAACHWTGLPKLTIESKLNSGVECIHKHRNSPLNSLNFYQLSHVP